jgi:putative endonuclease
MTSTPYFTYILECADTTLYIGITNDLKKRVSEHNDSKRGAKYTKVRRPVVLKYAEEFPNRSEALKREYELKQWAREKKLALIKAGVYC